MENSRTKKVLLAATSIVVALVIGEVATRWLLPTWYRRSQTQLPRTISGYSPAINTYDPEIGWALSPGSVKSYHALVPNVGYSINHGERLTSLRPRSGPVIVATGCSFTFGQGIPDEDTWPWLLQERLLDYHVVNVAAMGYGTDQALLAAEREVSRFPGEVHTVVLGFADFQIDRNRCPQSWLSTICPFSKPQFVQKGTGLQYRGQAKFWSSGGVVDNIINHSFLLSSIADLVADRIVYRIERHDGGRQLTVALITDFARRFQSRGIRLVVVVLPYFADQSPQSKTDRTYVVSQLRAGGIPTLVMDIPRLPDGGMAPGLTVGTHPNRRYNSLLVGQLTPFLTSLSKPEGYGASLRR